MKKLIPALLAMLSFGFSTAAPAGDRFQGYNDWRGGGHGHGSGHGYGRGYGHYNHNHGYRSSFSVVLGAPLYWPSYYSSYGWYARPPVIVQQAPVTYVQRELPSAPASAQADYWYYCPDTRSYYPYTQTCPSEWLQVVPQTAPR